jgi:threonine/homoserine/homoserine lactone efflux protein
MKRRSVSSTLDHRLFAWFVILGISAATITVIILAFLIYSGLFNQYQQLDVDLWE